MMSEFKSWEKMTEVERLQNTFSDYYKDTYGHRPRWMSDHEWNDEQWLKEQIARLDNFNGEQ